MSNDSANSKQIGGSHYKIKYQPWDFFCDVELHYLLACAIKYIARWRHKNGTEDLRKAIHYLQKADEKGVYVTERKISLLWKPSKQSLFYKFASQFGQMEQWLIEHIHTCDHQFNYSRCIIPKIEELIDAVGQHVDPILKRKHDEQIKEIKDAQYNLGVSDTKTFAVGVIVDDHLLTDKCKNRARWLIENT